MQRTCFDLSSSLLASISPFPGLCLYVLACCAKIKVSESLLGHILCICCILESVRVIINDE